MWHEVREQDTCRWRRKKICQAYSHGASHTSRPLYTGKRGLEGKQSDLSEILQWGMTQPTIHWISCSLDYYFFINNFSKILPGPHCFHCSVTVYSLLLSSPLPKRQLIPLVTALGDSTQCQVGPASLTFCFPFPPPSLWGRRGSISLSSANLAASIAFDIISN